MLHLFERIEIVSTRIHTGNITKYSIMLQHESLIERLRLFILKTGSTSCYSIYCLLYAPVQYYPGFTQYSLFSPN